MKDSPSRPQLLAARGGSEAELAAIIARYMPFIRRTARKAQGPGLDFDDAVQEGLIGLFAAIQNYRFDSAASFSTYASACIHNAILTAWRRSLRKKHAPLNQSVPIPEEQSIPGPEAGADAREQVDVTLERARTLLSGMEKQVLFLYLDGYSYQAIARRIGKSEKAVDNALARLRRKLKT